MLNSGLKMHHQKYFITVELYRTDECVGVYGLHNISGRGKGYKTRDGLGQKFSPGTVATLTQHIYYLHMCTDGEIT